MPMTGPGSGACPAVTVFYGTHINRLDAKGRVSVPADFRETLRDQDRDMTIVLFPSTRHACIEAYPAAQHAALVRRLEQLDPIGTEYEDLATSLYSDAVRVLPDAQGRILLPQKLIAHAELGEEIAFVSVGSRFQIWSAATVEARKAAARNRAGTIGLPAELRA